MVTAAEEWRPIPGYEDRYEVSSYGRVRSMPFWTRNRWGPMLRRGKLRAQKPNERGYMRVWLADGEGSYESVLVHRLVLMAFVGPPPEDAPNGLHSNDDTSNNHVSNLYWGNQRQNMADCMDNGHHYQLIKDVCPLEHFLVAPNLVEWQVDQGKRTCLACSLTANNHHQDALAAAAGRPRTRRNRGRDGFTRRIGESFEDEAHRRYAHIMRDYGGEL